MDDGHYDWIIIGSGFGGSVSALRLADKGYRVLVIEKGKRFAEEDFPKTNWDLRRWMWMPQMGMRGIFQMSFFEHVTVMHGVGVGGGSLVYANTLPKPSPSFFQAGSWAHLADWERELEPHYATARRMLGATPNQYKTRGDEVLEDIARDIGRDDHVGPNDVSVFFGEPGKRVPDPYFGGEGPDRVGCTGCGACMTGCRVGAKNTLDKNYLYLAERHGARVEAETTVDAVRPRESVEGGYRVETSSTFASKEKRAFTADRVIFAGGVMGTVPLLLNLRRDSQCLPALSPRVGDFVRTNNEAIVGVVIPGARDDYSKGVAITSILHTDEHSHIEPVRYGAGSGFFRLMTLPYSPEPTAAGRLASLVRSVGRHPLRWARVMGVKDWARQSQVLLYMRTLEGTMSLRLERSLYTGFREGLVSRIDDSGARPTSFMPEAKDLAERFADKVGGVCTTLMTETLFGTPSTAHILGGACMGTDAGEGVVGPDHRVHGYDGLYVIDGSAVSANPGVNPSLTITAMAERAMSQIPAKAA